MARAVRAEALPPLSSDPGRLESAPRVLVRDFELQGAVTPGRRECLEELLEAYRGRLLGTDALLVSPLNE